MRVARNPHRAAGDRNGGGLERDPAGRGLLDRAREEARRAGHDFVGVGHLLAALLVTSERLRQRCASRGEDPDRLASLVRSRVV
jgi:hypothetical protein